MPHAIPAQTHSAFYLPQLQNISFPALTTIQTTIETVFSNRDAIGRAWEAFLIF